MEKVMQPKKVIKLTEAEKKVLSVYAGYLSDNIPKTLHTNANDKRVID